MRHWTGGTRIPLLSHQEEVCCRKVPGRQLTCATERGITVEQWTGLDTEDTSSIDFLWTQTTAPQPAQQYYRTHVSWSCIHCICIDYTHHLYCCNQTHGFFLPLSESVPLSPSSGQDLEISLQLPSSKLWRFALKLLSVSKPLHLWH